MKKIQKTDINGAEIGHRFGMALNDIDNGDFEAAQGQATWLKEHGYPDQAGSIVARIPESEVKCVHGSTTTKTTRDGEDPYGYWLISAQVCDHCGTELDIPDRKYIITKPKPKSTIAAESMPETETPETPEPETEKEKAVKMLAEKFSKEGAEVYTPEPETETETETPEPLTKEKAKYWYSVAKKDISEGNIEGAYNLLKFFENHGNKMYARLLKKALDKAIPETETPETPEPEIKAIETVHPVYGPVAEIKDPEPETGTEPEDPEPETETETEPDKGPEGKLRATIDKKVLRAFVDPMAALSDEIKATITKTGLTVKIVDPAHVAMLETTIEKRAFTEYKASDFELGLDLDKLQSFLKKGNQKKGAYISVDYDYDHNKTIWGNGINNRTIATIDTSGMSDPKVPNLNLPNAFTVDRKTLLEAIKEAAEVSDHVELISGPEGIEINAQGDTDNTTAKIPRGILPELNAREKHRTLFSLDYLESMVKAIKSETVSIEMGTDYPLIMRYEHDRIKGMYLLAPRIETD